MATVRIPTPLRTYTQNQAEVKASVPVQDYNRAWPMWREKALAQLRAAKKAR